MSAESNKELVSRFWRDMRSIDDLDLMDELYDPKVKYHGAGGEELQGAEELRDYVSGYFGAFPDLVVDAKTVFAEGDWVASRWEATGTHRGELQGIPATNKKVVISAATIQRFENGKVVEEWEYPDLMSVMAQLGVMEA